MVHEAGRLVGSRVGRTEDRRLLTGRGRFVANERVLGALHAVFVRSSVAHGRLGRVDVEDARRAPGVVAVFTAADLVSIARPIAVANPAIPALPAYSALASDKVRHVGDPVAVVVASTLASAVDAAELVHVDIDPLPATVDLFAAASEGSSVVWDELGSNVLWSDARSFGASGDGVSTGSAHRLTQHRVSNAPMEPRAILAEFDGTTARLTIRTATQNPQLLRASLAGLLGLPMSDVRVINGDIGGSFGQKGWVRPEDVVIAAASVMLARPVRWVETRTENLTVGGHAREEAADIEAVLDAEGRLRGLRAEVVLDQGAYPIPSSVRTGTLALMRTLLPAVYDLESLDFRGTLVASNKGSYVTYRGPWAAETWFRERAIDLAARRHQIEPLELRRRSVIRTGTPRAMLTGPTLDGLTVGDALDRLHEHPRVARFRAEQAEARAAGRLLGMGVSVYIEPAPGPPDFFPSVAGFHAPPEDALVRMEPDGSVELTITQTPSGQGHETTYAMVVADELGLPLHRVRVQHGDTTLEPFDYFGSGGSRSAQKTTGAARQAAIVVRDKVAAIAASLLEANPDDIELADGKVGVRGSPDRGLDLARVATLAWLAPEHLPAGMERGLWARSTYENRDSFFSQGVHCCFVEIDAETGSIAIDGYVVLEDCGDVIHPEIVDDQIRGGVLQGIATVLYERHRYDEDGNLLTGSFVDYLLPSAVEAPTIEIHHVHGPSRTTVNHRGVGEGGAIAAPAAVTNAIEDALAHLGVRITTLHVTPADVVAAMAGARASER